MRHMSLRGTLAVIAGLVIVGFSIKIGASAAQQAIGMQAAHRVDSEKRSLEKAEREITVDIGDKEHTLKVMHYAGQGPRNGFLVESQAVLEKVTASYGYEAPRVDFDASVVLFVPAWHPQCMKLELDSAWFEKGKLDGIVATQLLAGKEPQQNEAFVLVVLSKRLFQ